MNAAVPLLAVVLAAAAVVAAIGAIAAEARGRRRAFHLLKPLATALVFAVALAVPAADETYRRLIAAGLLFSLAGDVFLMLPRDRFVAGLASFLVAHLLYLAAFARGGAGVTPGLVAFFAAFAGVFVRLLWPHLGGLRLPVAAYAAALSAMAWQAAEGALAGRPGAALAAAGALLFAASDGMLAWNRFVRPLPHAQALVLSTYWAAQLLIALAIR